LRERGWGVPIPTRGQTLWCSRYICIMHSVASIKVKRLSVEAFSRKVVVPENYQNYKNGVVSNQLTNVEREGCFCSGGSESVDKKTK
jgi:hypothetical protein